MKCFEFVPNQIDNHKKYIFDFEFDQYRSFLRFNRLKTAFQPDLKHTMLHLLIAPIESYRAVKRDIFQNFRKINFDVDIRIQLEKLNILRGLFNMFGQSTPNHDFSLYIECCA